MTGLSDPVPSVGAMRIDCGSCTMAGLACDDCVVTVLLGPPGLEAPVPLAPAVAEVPAEHAPALEVLAQAGLVPPLRLVPRAG